MIKNNKGFTLIALLAAIAILSILMVLALPQFTNIIGRNRDKVYISDALNIFEWRSMPNLLRRNIIRANTRESRRIVEKNAQNSLETSFL